MQSWLYTYNDGWDYVEGYAPRVLDSVVLEPGEKELLIQDIAKFRKAKDRYARLGIPYHRGYLFYGPPGTGKTSLVSAMAAHFALSIYSVNLTEFNDRTLTRAVNQVPSNSLLLFEDIDCMKGAKNRDAEKNDRDNPKSAGSASQNGITLSGLLNVLDGFYAPSNVLFVMTTNHIEELDDALLRPGRIDYKLYLGKASDRQKVALYRKFFPDASEFEAREFVESACASETMAEFQGILLAFEQDRENWAGNKRVVHTAASSNGVSRS